MTVMMMTVMMIMVMITVIRSDDDGDDGYGDGDYDGDDGECLKNLSRRLSQFAVWWRGDDDGKLPFLMLENQMMVSSNYNWDEKNM